MRLRFAMMTASALAIACGGASTKNNNSTSVDTRAAPARGGGGGGVSITGEHAYDDRHDSSGWSGKTTPPGAIGGGPATSASPSASPPSKELDTSPPSKELQF